MSLPYLLFYCSFGYLLVCAISRWRKFRRALVRIGYYPGERTLFGVSSHMGGMLPHIPYVAHGHNHSWRTKHQVFERLGTDIYGTASVFPPDAYLTIADPAGVKHVSYPRNNFVKHTEFYTIFNAFGSNLLTVEGEEWRRQRRVVAPAFSDKNNRLVWDTAKEHLKQVISTWESEKPTIVHNVRDELTLPLSISVIAKTGFGQDMSWVTNAVPPGHKLTFKEAFLKTCRTLDLPLVVPSWALGLRKGWRQAKQAHEELRMYLQEMVTTRRELKEKQTSDLPDQRHDLLDRLIHARDVEDTLTEDELIGNMFIFIFGGHETSAHTFAITLSMLALYPEVQDKLFKQIRELEQEHGELTYDHSQLLTYAMAVIYEILRLFPMVAVLPKKANADTTVTASLPPNTQVQVSESTTVHVFSTGLHYNPNYWENPDEFAPERFMDPHWNRDAFIPFSLGPRACIGRRFSETALTAELTTLISKYKVSIDESRFKFIQGESILERRARLISPEIRLTLNPAPISLTFSPRD